MAVWPPNSPIDLRAGDDTQLHVPYTAYTFLVAGYTQDVRFGGATGPGWVLACVEINSTPSRRRSDEDNIASMAWGARNLISTQNVAEKNVPGAGVRRRDSGDAETRS